MRNEVQYVHNKFQGQTFTKEKSHFLDSLNFLQSSDEVFFFFFFYLSDLLKPVAMYCFFFYYFSAHETSFGYLHSRTISIYPLIPVCILFLNLYDPTGKKLKGRNAYGSFDPLHFFVVSSLFYCQQDISITV